MAAADRETALVFEPPMIAAGAGAIWLAVKQFTRPVETTNALAKLLGGRLVAPFFASC